MFSFNIFGFLATEPMQLFNNIQQNIYNSVITLIYMAIVFNRELTKRTHTTYSPFYLHLDVKNHLFCRMMQSKMILLKILRYFIKKMFSDIPKSQKINENMIHSFHDYSKSS